MKLKSKITYIIAPAVLCWCLFYLQSCKDPAVEDKHLLTKDDDLNLAKDTLKVKVFSEFEQPINSNGVGISQLGSISDPDFGTTFASFYAQCELSSNNIYFGDSAVLDSAFLMLQYNGAYGKFDKPVDINVYELAQDISDTTAYKTNQSFTVNIPPVGTLHNYTLGTKLTDSI